MRILCFNWKDRDNPLAGGAEIVTEELLTRLAQDGHTVVLLTSGFIKSPQVSTKNGYTIIRVGGRWSVYWQAYRYYRKYLQNHFDVIIEEINTLPFFTKIYAREPVLLFIHQLAREIWFYEMKFPLSLAGYLLEPFYLWLLSSLKVVTVSESSKKDLERYGFRDVHIISEGILLTPLKTLESVRKRKRPTLLAFGAIRSMKRTQHIVEAFESAKRTLPTLQLIVAGAPLGRYGTSVTERIARSPYRRDISCMGSVTPLQKITLMRESHLIAVTSIKEGWGLIVTEANSQGTPAVVYNVDGLRDSVQDKKTGLITPINTPHELARAVEHLFSNPTYYETLRRNAWGWSKEITFEKSYSDFYAVLKQIWNKHP